MYKRLGIFCVLLPSLVLWSLAFAQPAEKTIVLRPSWLIDATGNAPVTDGVVIVRGNRIEEVGTAATVAIPPGADVIELPGQTLLPGLIDTHSHLSNRSMYPSRFGRRGPANEEMMKVIRHGRAQLLCGITTLRQAGERHYNDLLYKEAVNLGMHVGPRIISAGQTITASSVGSSGTLEPTDGADAIRKKVRENFELGAEWIKLTNIDMTPTSGSMTTEELEAAVDEAHRLGMKVTVHATGRWGSAVRAAVEAGADNIEHARPLTEEIVKLMLKKGTTVSLTPLAYVGWYPRPEDFDMLDFGVSSATEWMDYLDATVAAFRKAHPEVETTERPFVSPISGTKEGWRVDRDIYEALQTVQKQYLRAHQMGLPFSLGLDARLCGQAWQMEFLVDGKIPPMDVIRSATSVAARLIGYGDRIGTIEQGKLADLISVEGNPLEDMSAMRRVRLVMRDGVRYDNLSWR